MSDTNTKPQESAWTGPVKLDYEQYATDSTWASNAVTYTFTEEPGDVGVPNPQLEKLLFANSGHAGDALSALELEVSVEGPNKVAPVRNFDDTGLHPVVRENLDLSGYNTPTAVQGYCIPAVLQGHDVMAVAPTGSGKTAAYLVPIASKLMGKVAKIGGPKVDTTAPDYNPALHRVRAEPLVVIVCPTRELAQQIFDMSRKFCYRSKLRPVCTYGGVPVLENIKQLEKGCDILIATPGRLCDLMDRPHVLSLNRVKFTVIDEADEMLDSGWETALTKIMAGGDTNEDADHVFMMFSATFPKEARSLARQYMASDYTRIRVGRAGSAHKNVKQVINYVEEDLKKQAVHDLLYSMEPGLTMIFCNAVRGVENLDDFLFNGGLPTTFMHRTQHERDDAMRAFVSGKSPILITTAVAARGIDIRNVATVINFDLPSVDHGGIDEYVHRCGRTGRIGWQGTAISFFNDRNVDLGPALVNLLLETDQEVPDFLQQYKPVSGIAEFHDDTDEDEPADAGDAGAAWGGPPADGDEDAGNAWGVPAAAADDENKVSAW